MDAAALATIHGLRSFDPSLARRLSHTLREADKTACDALGDRDLQSHLTAHPIEAHLQLEGVVQLALEFVRHLGEARP